MGGITLVAIAEMRALGLEGLLPELRDLQRHFPGLGPEPALVGAGPGVPASLRALLTIVERSWLNQRGDVIARYGISLLWWRSEVVKQPHDMPP